MKKMAIFVEGKTELCFVARLLREIIDARKFQLVLRKAGGGNRDVRQFTIFQDSGSNADKKYYILITDSGNDGRVKSDIRDTYENLVSSGYSVIIGIRDVYPDFLLEEVGRLRSGLHYRLKTKPIPVLFVLGLMEIEAWFLAEYTHFQRVHPSLTVSRIKEELDFDPVSDDMQERLHPAKDLHEIYALEGLAYKKNAKQIKRTINALDYTDMYLSHRTKFFDVDMFMKKLDEFFD